MAIIYTYPVDNSLEAQDTIVISKSDKENATRITTLGDLAAFVNGGTVFADKAWQKFTFSSAGVPATLFPEVVPDEVNSTLNFTSAGGSITFATTYDPIAKQYTVNMEDQGLDGNIASRNLWFDGDWTTSLWNNVTEALHTWTLGTRLPQASASPLDWDTVMKFDSSQIQIGTNPAASGTPQKDSSFFIPINNNSQGTRNIYIGGGVNGAITSNHRYDTDSVALGVDALINSGLNSFFGAVTSLNLLGLPTGTNYTASTGPTLVTTTSGSGENLTIEWTVNGGNQVDGITIVNGGSGYNIADTITVPGGDGNAVIPITAVSTVGDNNENVAIGNSALKNFGLSSYVPTGLGQFGQNVAVGFASQTLNTGALLEPVTGTEFSGSFNVSVGGRSLEDLDGGETNTVLGHNAAFTATQAYGNVVIGFEAADGGPSGTTVPTSGLINNPVSGLAPAFNVIIGQEADAGSALGATVLGGGAQAVYNQLGGLDPDNSVVIGFGGIAYGTENVLIGGSQVEGPLATPYDPEAGRYIMIGVGQIFQPTTFGAGETYSTMIGTAAQQYGSFNDQQGNYSIIGTPTDTSYDNVLMGNNGSVAGGENVSLGADGKIGYSNVFWPNPPVFLGSILGSVGLGFRHFIDSDYTFQVAFNGNPHINLVSQENGLGLSSSMLLDGNLQISGFNGAGGVNECFLGFERTEFFGQTILGTATYNGIVSAITVPWNANDGDIQILNIDPLDPGPIYSFQIDFPLNIGAGEYKLIINNPGGNAYTIIWGAGNFKWVGGVVPAPTSTNATDIISFTSDGTNLYGTVETNFQ